VNSPAACKTDEVKVYKRMLLCVVHSNSIYTSNRLVVLCFEKMNTANRVQCPKASKAIYEKVPRVSVYHNLLINAELVCLDSVDIELMSRRTFL
jgi:hypothetical protein